MLCLRPKPQTWIYWASCFVFGSLFFIYEGVGAFETLSSPEGQQNLPLLRASRANEKDQKDLRSLPLLGDQNVKPARSVRQRQASRKPMHRRGLRLCMSKCVYSPLAELGKQNVSGKQKRAFLLNLVQRGCWLYTKREHCQTNVCPRKTGSFPSARAFGEESAPLLTPILRSWGGREAPGEQLPTQSPILPPLQVPVTRCSCLLVASCTWAMSKYVFLFQI